MLADESVCFSALTSIEVFVKFVNQLFLFSGPCTRQNMNLNYITYNIFVAWDKTNLLVACSFSLIRFLALIAACSIYLR